MKLDHSVLQSARLFFAGTLLSRCGGLLREMAMAFCFGSSPAVAAFMVAYRLANLFRRLLGEGNLQAGFVPHFEALYVKSPREALLFYRDVAFSLAALLVLTILGMEGVLWWVGGSVGEGWKEITHLAMWMAPGLLFICLYGLNSALLQCKRRFFLGASAPAFFNLIWIFFAFTVRSMSELAVGITVAFMAQWMLTTWQVRKEVFSHLTWGEWMRPQLFSESWRRLMGSLGLGIVGVGAVQINSAFDAIFARMADLSGPSYLWYAIRVEQLPLALFGIALSGAALPPLARAIQGGEKERYRDLLRGALRQAAALMIPCTFGLFVLGEGGLRVLYLHGHFSEGDLQKTLYCLWGYGVGLVPSVWVLLLAAGFYARKSYGVPVVASLTSVACNMLLNALFIFGLKWGVMSVAMATSVSSLLNAALLNYFLKREVGSVQDLKFLGKMTVCSAVPAALVLLVGGPFVLQIALYGAGVLGLSRLLKIEELFQLLKRRAA